MVGQKEKQANTRVNPWEAPPLPSPRVPVGPMWVRTSQGVCQRLGKPQASQLWARSKIIAASKTVASCGRLPPPPGARGPVGLVFGASAARVGGLDKGNHERGRTGEILKRELDSKAELLPFQARSLPFALAHWNEKAMSSFKTKNGNKNTILKQIDDPKDIRLALSTQNSFDQITPWRRVSQSNASGISQKDPPKQGLLYKSECV